MNDIGSIILYCCITFVVTAIIVGLIFFKIGIAYRKKVAETEIGNAEEQALKIINDAHKNAKAKEKEIVVEAKEEIHRMRAEADKDIKDRRSEVTRQERRIQQKEETLDRKIDNLEKKEEVIQQKQQAVEEQLAEAEKIKKSQIDQLERISGLTASQAKDQLLDALESELAHEKALKIFERSGAIFGRGLAVLIDLLNPERIIAGSVYARSHHFLDSAMYRELKKEALAPSLAACRIVPAALGERIGDYAAISAALE